MATPSPEQLSEALRSLADSYAKANQGSGEHPLGLATVLPLQEVLQPGSPLPGVLQGYGIRFEDGTTYLVNVHLIPGTVPK